MVGRRLYNFLVDSDLYNMRGVNDCERRRIVTFMGN